MNRSIVSKYLYIFSFVLVILVDFLSRTMFVERFSFLRSVSKILIIAACIMVLIKLLIDEHRKIELYSILILIPVLSVIIYTTKTYYTLLPIFLLVISVRNINLEKILRIWLFEIAILMILVSFSYYVDIIGETTRVFGREGDKIRYGLGYGYSSFSANYFFHFTLFYSFIRREKIRILEILALFVINYYLYLKTDTKSAFACSILLLFLVLIIKYFKLSKQINFLNKYTMLIGFIISLGTLFLYRFGTEIGELLNTLVTGRLRLADKAWDEFGITIFGQKILWVTENQWMSEIEYDYVDSSFLNILFNYGIVLILLIIIGYYLLGKKKLSNNIFYTLMIGILGIHCIYDPQLLEISHNPSILFLGYLITGSDIIYNLKR